jgi:uncharacterized membrane protein (Fun14 family)
MEESAQPRHPNLVDHVTTMPRWQKSLLTLAAILLAGGAAGQAMGYFQHRSSPDVTTSAHNSGPAAPANSRGIVSGKPSPDEPEAHAEPKPTIVDKLSPFATKFGGTFIVGFLIGWAFRAFLKVMTTVTIAGAAIITGLSYFNVMNIDMTKAEKQYESSKVWVTDQASRLKDAVTSHLPVSGASVLGMFVGFRRKS